MVFGGLIRQRVIWFPTWRGIVALGALLALIGILLATSIHPFLAVDRPVGGEILVVEGWLSKRGLTRAISTFRDGGYQRLLTTGVRIPAGSYVGDFYPDYRTFAELSAAVFREAGVDSDLVVAVSTPDVKRDRTYASGLAIRKWLDETGSRVQAVDVLSGGPHARRTWLLFHLALGDRVQVGVIGQRPTAYDPDRWWTSSTGVRTVIGEAIAYGYTKFFFFPSNEH